MWRIFSFSEIRLRVFVLRCSLIGWILITWTRVTCPCLPASRQCNAIFTLDEPRSGSTFCPS